MARRFYSLFAKRAEEREARFDLRLRALGSVRPNRRHRGQSPFRNQPSRQAA